MVSLKHLANSLDYTGNSNNCNVPIFLVYDCFLKGRDKRDPPIVAASCLTNKGFTPGNYHGTWLEGPGVFSDCNYCIYKTSIEGVCKDRSNGSSALFPWNFKFGFSGSDFKVVSKQA